ncbi:chromate transporter [Paenibacillus sp. TRM 82003]|nr:chromate transporter [Paenibacillus sp. TRM 82003]MCI3923460.1 chromate transporter [Paenibacillus sp. TRM 82003]
MVWELFWTFLKIGFLSFGGGYAMIPVIEHEVLSHGWMTMDAYMNAVALAGMAPGPIATNSATFIGFATAGLPGAIAATVGMVLPSLLIIIVLASFFFKIYTHKIVKSSFYGLKPVVTGLILYSGLHFGFQEGANAILTWHTVAVLSIVAISALAILRWRMHPFHVILLSGAVGIFLFAGLGI